MVVSASDILEEKLDLFTLDQKKIIFENTVAIQLTQGCSSGCVDCGAGAILGVRSYIPFDNLEELFCSYNDCFINLETLYFASDPFDYNFEGHSYIDVHKMISSKLNNTISVSTSAPKGSEKEVLDFILSNNSLTIKDDKLQKPFINIFSVMKSNYSRLQKTFSEIDGYKNEDQTIVTDFSFLTKNLILPMNSNIKALNNSLMSVYGTNREGKLYAVKVDNNYVCSFGDYVTLDDILQHKKHLRRMELDDDNALSFNREMVVYDFYNDNLPSGRLHSYKLGENFKEDLSTTSIACFHGVVLNPQGIYNYQVVTPSKDEPIGWKKTEITPQNFNVVPYTGLLGFRNTFLKLGNRRLDGKNKFKDNLTKSKLYYLLTHW
jgi:hypothetical protein